MHYTKRSSGIWALLKFTWHAQLIIYMSKKQFAQHPHAGIQNKRDHARTASSSTTSQAMFSFFDVYIPSPSLILLHQHTSQGQAIKMSSADGCWEGRDATGSSWWGGSFPRIYMHDIVDGKNPALWYLDICFYIWFYLMNHARPFGTPKWYRILSMHASTKSSPLYGKQWYIFDLPVRQLHFLGLATRTTTWLTSFWMILLRGKWVPQRYFGNKLDIWGSLQYPAYINNLVKQ